MTNEINKKSNLERSLYDLADELSHLVVREHQILQDEMQRVRELVGDAVKSLDSNFRSLNERASEQATILDQVIESNDVNELQHQKLSTLRDEINSHTATTIRALQFDDIVQQLAGHTCDRIARMQELFAGLDGKIANIKELESFDEAEIQKYIKIMQEEVAHFRAKLEKENPVKQSSMSEGKIELF